METTNAKGSKKLIFIIVAVIVVLVILIIKFMGNGGTSPNASKKLKEMYNSIENLEEKESVIKKLGKPSDSYEYGDREVCTWELSDIEFLKITFTTDLAVNIDAEIDVTQREGYNVEGKKYSGLLKKAQEMYEKIEKSDTKESVVEKIGEPQLLEKYNFNEERYTWKIDNIELLTVEFEDDEIDGVDIELRTDEDYGIFMSKELNTPIDDLNDEISKIKEGMTVEEVRNILGDGMFEYEKFSYTWSNEVGYKAYDKQEKNLYISFEDGKVNLIGDVYDY